MAQQAVEKALKAYLFSRGEEIPAEYFDETDAEDAVRMAEEALTFVRERIEKGRGTNSIPYTIPKLNDCHDNPPIDVILNEAPYQVRGRLREVKNHTQRVRSSLTRNSKFI